MKNFIMKKMLKSQMKGVPVEQQEKIFKIFEENPELFTKIGKEIQELVKTGKDKMTAAMIVMEKYKEDLEKLK